MTDEEKEALKQEYENLKLLLEFHSVYGVPKDKKEMEEIVNQILDEMLSIKKRLEQK